MIVTDKYGKRVTRPNGIMLDGDTIRVPMTMMDSQNPALVAAAALAHSVQKAEQFDMKQHPQNARYGTQDAKTLDARAARDARTAEAWKKPTSATSADQASAKEHVAVVGADAPLEKLQAARDAAVTARDKRLEQAYRR
jgi:hypothetical protein